MHFARAAVALAAGLVAMTLAGQEPAAPPALEPWTSEPAGWRDVAFGASPWEVKKAIPGATCISKGTRHACASSHTVGPVPVREKWTFDGDGRLVMVAMQFDAGEYESVRAEMVERFGEPARRREATRTTVAGDTVEDEILLWYGERAAVVLQRYAGKVTEGSLRITERAWLKTRDGEQRDPGERSPQEP